MKYLIFIFGLLVCTALNAGQGTGIEKDHFCDPGIELTAYQVEAPTQVVEHVQVSGLYQDLFLYPCSTAEPVRDTGLLIKEKEKVRQRPCIQTGSLYILKPPKPCFFSS